MAGTKIRIADRVRDARAGDVDAFAALVRRERSSLIRTARAILRDPHEAEDCAQDAFVAAWQHLLELREPERFHPWLVTILVRLARRRRRGLLHRRTASDLSWLPGREESTSSRLAAVGREVARLPDRLRLPISLFYLAGLSYREAAAALGIPEGRVKSRLFEARRKLERRLRRERSE